MSYLKHWKLRYPPFRPPQSFHDVFLGGTVEEAVARGDFLITHRKRLGFVVGPTGVGKSTVVQYLCQSRNFKTTNEHTCIVQLLGQTPYDIVSHALRQLDPEMPLDHTSVEQCILRISDMMMSWRTVGHHTVFVFDEANDVTASNLELFARISRIPGVTALLCVNDETLVDLPRWIVEWSELRIDLPPWDLGQVADYFEFAITGAGGDPNLFDAQAMTRVQELSDGIPRRIAQLADLSLVSGAVRKLDQIRVDVVEEVCNEFTLSIGTNFPVFWEGSQLNTGFREQELK
jgi:type II secretory pathway predicted ATPase ExeA